jgi:hypothetical protein
LRVHKNNKHTIMSNIKIIGAAYGAVEGSYDVTDRVREHIIEKGDTLEVNNNNLGDPAPTYGKHFGVVYQINGETKSRACKEGQTVHFD